MLTQFAAATAVKGTNRPINGGADLTNELRPIAVTRAPPVAETYAVPVKKNVSFYACGHLVANASSPKTPILIGESPLLLE